MLASAAIVVSLKGGPAAPASSVTAINVLLKDSGGPRGVGDGPLRAGVMGLSADQATAPHGKVSFRVTNAGAVAHEMVILPLTVSQEVGSRPFGAGAKVDESGSLGETSSSGGGGIAPGASSVLTVTLAPGQYELVCNFMGHYVSGMYGRLTIT